MSVFCLEDAQMHFPDFRKARFWEYLHQNSQFWSKILGQVVN